MNPLNALPKQESIVNLGSKPSLVSKPKIGGDSTSKPIFESQNQHPIVKAPTGSKPNFGIKKMEKPKAQQYTPPPAIFQPKEPENKKPVDEWGMDDKSNGMKEEMLSDEASIVPGSYTK